MSTPTPPPYDWLKQVPHAVVELDTVPLMGYPPKFPWESFTQELSKIFKIEEFKVTQSHFEWRLADKLFEGLPENLASFPFTVSPIAGNIFWLMAESDIDVVMQLLIAKESDPLQNLDQEFKEGFSRFLVFEVIHVLSRLDYDKNLTYHYSENQEKPHGTSLCIDVQILLLGRAINGRMVISEDFHRSWKEHYAQQPVDFITNSSLAQKLGIVLHVEAGRSTFKLSEWKSIHPGDFFILDHCSYDPDEEKGRVMITVEGHPYFRAKLKQGNVKILEFPLYHEVYEQMSKQPTEDEDDEFEHADESALEDDFEEESEFENEDFHEDEDFEFEEEEHSDLEEQEDFEYEELESVEKKASQAAAPVPKPSAEKREKATDKPAPLKEGERPKVQELSINVIVEVGKIEMTVQKFLELEPGNLLELDVKPENGVNLVVNGKYIGKGELLRIGDALGVRVLDIG